jgi:hypothetical protein
MKKLEKKQIPAVVACGAVIVGALGYTAYQFSSSQPKPKPTPPQNLQASAANPSYGPDTPAPGDGASAAPAVAVTAPPGGNKTLARFATVPPSYSADPFNPVYREETLDARTHKAAAQMKKFGSALGKAFANFGRAVRESVNMNAPQLPPSGEWTPAALRGYPQTPEMGPEVASDPGATAGPGGGAPGAAFGPGATPAPAVERPQLTLTGVIQGDPSVAILRGQSDQERQVVRAGDRVAGRYVVKSITTEGVLLAAASGGEADRWFLPLGDQKQ